MSVRPVVRCGALALLVAGCELPEVAVPDGETMIAVHAVMRADQSYQWVLVEQTLVGSEDVDGALAIPGDVPPRPVSGAAVTVVNASFADDPCGAVPFAENAPPAGVTPTPGVYWSPAGCPSMRRGDRLTLRVVTADGAFAVTGATVVPGTRAMTIGNGRDTVVMRGPTLSLNRDRDTLEIDAAGAEGRALQIEVLRPDEFGVLRVGFWLVVDSTRLTLPADLPDFVTAFTNDMAELPDVLPPVFAAGRSYVVTAGLGDANYYDFIRSGNIPPSGRGFINHLDGGIGVFGSMLAFENVVRVVGVLDDPREGAYRMVGEVLGVSVDVALELYVGTAGADTTDVAAFIVGDWVSGRIHGSLDGAFRGDSVELRVVQEMDMTVLRGLAPRSGPSTLTATVRTGIPLVAGTVTLTGPTPAPGAASTNRHRP